MAESTVSPLISGDTNRIARLLEQSRAGLEAAKNTNLNFAAGELKNKRGIEAATQAHIRSLAEQAAKDKADYERTKYTADATRGVAKINASKDLAIKGIPTQPGEAETGYSPDAVAMMRRLFDSEEFRRLSQGAEAGAKAGLFHLIDPNRPTSQLSTAPVRPGTPVGITQSALQQAIQAIIDKSGTKDVQVWKDMIFGATPGQPVGLRQREQRHEAYSDTTRKGGGLPSLLGVLGGRGGYGGEVLGRDSATKPSEPPAQKVSPVNIPGLQPLPVTSPENVNTILKVIRQSLKTPMQEASPGDQLHGFITGKDGKRYLVVTIEGDVYPGPRYIEFQ